MPELGAASLERRARVLGEAIRRGLARRADLEGVLVTRTRVRGATAFREAMARLPEGLERARSPLERLALQAIAAAGLPVPSVNHRMQTPTGAVLLDLAWPSQKLAWELDGARWHTAAGDVVSDLARQRAIEACGWRVRRSNWDDVAGGRFVPQLRRELFG